MTQDFTCGDHAALVGYLYGECDEVDRSAMEAHLAVCASCAVELTALGATRTALASWTPPAVDLGFRIASSRDGSSGEDTNVLRPARWWQRPLPAWGQAAAALLIFAAGAMLGMQGSAVQGRNAQGSGAVQTTEPVSVVAPPARSHVSSVSAADLTALEQRLRAEMSTMRTASDARFTHPSSADDAVVRRVQALLAESEQRQERELALRVAQVIRDVDTQRRTDMSMIERTFGQMERVTRPELAQQREAINYLIRTASQRAPQ